MQTDLGGRNPDAFLEWESIDGISLTPFLHRADLDEVAHAAPDPEAPPLTDPSALVNDWRIRQNLDAPDPDAARALAMAAVNSGCTDLGLVLGPPNQRRLDGRAGLRSVLAEIPADTPLHLDRGPAAVLGALVLQQEHDTAPASIAYDPVAALATGALGDAARAFDLAVDLLSSVPDTTRSLSVDLRPYHNAGASAVQELAYGLSALSETLHRYTERGVALGPLLPRLQCHIAVSTSYFVEIAKLRALRLLVPQVLDAYAETASVNVSVAASDLFVQAETSRRTATVLDPLVNMLRHTTEAMAAVLGKCDVLSVRPHDDCRRPPDRFGTRIARNVQLILQHEAHFDIVDDPAAGAYYLETATDRLARRAWSQFQTLEDNGGMLSALRDGRVQSTIADVRDERRRAVDDRDRVLVGTNHYPSADEDIFPSKNIFSRNNGNRTPLQWDASALNTLRNALEESPTLSALVHRLSATGEAEIAPLPSVRVGVGIEDMRRRTDRYASERGTPPLVLLAPLGPPGARSARASFARNFLGVAGFEIHSPLKFDAPEAVAERIGALSPEIVVLCSADAEYPSLTATLRSALADHDDSPLLLVVGDPAEMEDEVPADTFIHQDSPLRATLEALQDRLGLPKIDD
ncbi:MAG: methylmalonyl-CoA mutase [Bacteroidetes bacterium SW_9_63_38]|nr:MAG: methylmalonyl-CoA mutase [Bacteroidetes bacterium SW_9_63_38]